MRRGGRGSAPRWRGGGRPYAKLAAVSLLLPSPCLVVLAGPAASGKSTWAAAHFPPSAVVSSDALRGVVGAGEDDIAASTDAFALLDEIVARRVGARADHRRRHDRDGRRAPRPLADARARARDGVRRGRRRHAGRACAGPATAPGRHPVPAAALTAQLRAWPAVRDALDGEGFDQVLRPEPVRVVPQPFARSPTPPRRASRTSRSGCGSRCTSRRSPAAPRPWRPGCARSPPRPRRRASTRSTRWTTSARSRRSDARGTTSSRASRRSRGWRRARRGCGSARSSRASPTATSGTSRRSSPPWTCCPAAEPCAASGWAGSPRSTGRTGGRSRRSASATPCSRTRSRRCRCCGGRAASRSAGRVLDLPDTAAYPRPLQEHVPILLGGGGERRTLALAARYADVANVLGDLPTVARKAAVLRAHCAEAGREVALSHLTTALVGADPAELEALVDAAPPARRGPGAVGGRRARGHGRRPDRAVPRAGRGRGRRRWPCGSWTSSTPSRSRAWRR